MTIDLRARESRSECEGWACTDLVIGDATSNHHVCGRSESDVYLKRATDS